VSSAVYDRRLADLGWTVLRFWNDDVLRESGNVCQHVVVAAGLAEPETAILSAATPATERPRP
jgi:very-short-patch-repair endonuclease